VSRLAWRDPPLGTMSLPKARLDLSAGFGSGLARRPEDPPGRIWAVCDCGPNLKLSTARTRYGLDAVDESRAGPGAKIMPRPDLGPALAELQLFEDRVELVRTIRLADRAGRPVSGLPVAGGERAYSLAGRPFDPDPSGADTEGVAALAGGDFWIGDEYGPSLLRVDRNGQVALRLVPAGSEGRFQGAGYPVAGSLPAIAARRRLNRGFEALALSPDEQWLYFAFQSPLGDPDADAAAPSRHLRLWKLDAGSGSVVAQFLYPLDPPESFARDSARGPVGWDDLKVCELAAAGAQHLLVLERGSESAKVHRVKLGGAAEIPPVHLDAATRPTIEQLSAQDRLDVPVLAKERLFTSDDAPQVAADLEGMVLLSPSELLMVTDNDFGVEGAETSFWRIRFDAPVADG
jgi:hypothetical protein